ncbi:DNA-binding response regulator, OmpR family, contains REC and winged-helix (wHTH) domain [Modestobacter sp. DSM 44400]|uniref:response regulator transcription factor n=1 Tax=Modestobacter sp. DSM 44400 TaxID=1550230 RepID=UPI000899F3F4|nr:response regulator transcription factor [Modestobacter sp. DSM 44400]SDY49746.1 DNA-binding response regulator, OmpR family, contains REC and winged-helix (wHTH) domain [Modestobacter sp. DSM 44400]
MPPVDDDTMKVLVVDDEVRLAQSVARGLRADGFTVDLTHDGISGRDAAMSGAYDAIVLDIMLPGLQGYRVLQQLREASVRTPVLMLTAKDGEYDEADAFDLGADDYLTKPFSFVVLIARLRSLVRRAASTRPSVLRAGDLELDPSRHRVTRAGTELTLTPREFELLAYLMRNADVVLSKTHLLHAVWDEAFDGDVNNVEIYVSYLRKKIDLPFGRSSIRTVRGAGYAFSPDGG